MVSRTVNLEYTEIDVYFSRPSRPIGGCVQWSVGVRYSPVGPAMEVAAPSDRGKLVQGLAERLRQAADMEGWGLVVEAAEEYQR